MLVEVGLLIIVRDGEGRLVWAANPEYVRSNSPDEYWYKHVTGRGMFFSKGWRNNLFMPVIYSVAWDEMNAS